MELSSPPGRWGDNFFGPWGTLHFHLPLVWWLSQMGSSTFSTLFLGGRSAYSKLNSTFILKYFFQSCIMTTEMY